MNKFLIFSSILLLMACGSTSVKKKVDLPALAPNAPVTVYQGHAPFRYEVICEIDIHRKGNFVATSLDSYKSNVETEARKCGADKGLLLDLSGTQMTNYSAYGASTSYDLNVKAYGIRQTSEMDKLNDGETLKKMGKAVNLNNVEVLRKLLASVNKDPMQRSLFDDDVLKFLTYNNAAVGGDCPAKTLAVLTDEYNVKLSQIKMKFGTKTHDPEDLGLCGNILEKSYANFDNRIDVLTYVNNISVGLLNYYSGSKKDLDGLKSLSKVMPLVSAEISAACKQDETSETCIFKQRFAEIKSAIQQVLPKEKSAPAKKELNQMMKGIYFI